MALGDRRYLSQPDPPPGPASRPRAGLLRRGLNRFGPSLLLGTLVFLISSPLLALLHELLVLGTARLLNWLGSSGARLSVEGAIPLDPVYTGTLFLLLADIQVTGLAVVWPLGAALHAVAPGLFAPPELLPSGALLGAVIQPGASVLARSLVDLVGDVALLALGIGLVWAGRRPAGLSRRLQLGAGPHWLLVFGALLQAQVVVQYLADDTLSIRDLEATGLTYGFSVLFTGPAAERPRLSALLLALPAPARTGVLTSVSIGVGYLLALSLTVGPWLLWRLPGLARRLAGWSGPRPSRRAALARRPLLAASGLAAFALGVALSPLGSFAEANSNYLAPTPTAAQSVSALVVPTSPPAPTATAPSAAQPRGGASPETGPGVASVAWTSRAAQPVRSGPSVVTLSGSNYRYTYTVNGRPEVIRGMGYNPMYHRLPAAERAARYDRDFATMSQSGVNTLVGWATEEFDGLLLDKAGEHGIGVILPYHLDPELDYTDPAVREQVARDVLAWVERYKNHPALRMWGPGNEVLHKLVYPSWMHIRGDPVLEARADAFALFYVGLIDLIHQADPNHPVTYRAAEDAYLGRLRDALNASGLHRSWFAFGVNVYTPHLADIIQGWEQYNLDSALIISEFAPGGAGPSDRPQGYRDLWSLIRSRPELVLGGAPYVWFTEGPEEVDRIFGLVDPDGVPVDGSLVAIAAFFKAEGEPRATNQQQLSAEPSCDQRVVRLAWETIQGLQAQKADYAFHASTPPSIMGPIDNLPADPLHAADLRFQRAGDPARQSWLRESGISAEWWATWSPPSRPGDELGLVLREHDGRLEVGYVYHGPGQHSDTAWRCGPAALP